MITPSQNDVADLHDQIEWAEARVAQLIAQGASAAELAKARETVEWWRATYKDARQRHLSYHYRGVR